MGFWKTAGWIAAGVGAVVAAPVTGGGSIAAVLGAAGTTTAAGVAVGAAAGLAGSALTDDSEDRARDAGRNEGRAEKAREVKKLKTALDKQEQHFQGHKDYENYLISLVSVGMACAACDGVIDYAEKEEIREFVTGLAGSRLPQNVQDRIREITTSAPSFNTAYRMAEPFMDTEQGKQDFLEVIESTIYADGIVSEREERFLEAWKHKMAA